MKSKHLRLAALLAVAATTQVYAQRWSEDKAARWYAERPWMVGANYIPANAINQLEMWQPETFDSARIDLELGWAESIGMNAMRVFLHDLPWKQDAGAYRRRIARFLDICARHRIKVLFVLFDSCGNGAPQPGRQPAPRPGVHNSGWVESPGLQAMMDPQEEARLEEYVTGVIRAFGSDARVIGWDLWNEPDNGYGGEGAEAARQLRRVEELLARSFDWARSCRPAQPLTSGVWKGRWASDEVLSSTERIQLAASDVISFHSYQNGPGFETRLRSLQRLKRPILCTEYMARSLNSTFEQCLPLGAKHRVAMMSWGLVRGKTQTHLPWDSIKNPYIGREPAVWFHDVFEFAGRPHRRAEIDFIKAITAGQNAQRN